ncbi:phospho-sugar mutase [Aureitalea marina]|uniref:Phosphoglucomutase n=1 Tax=Aureitalea marina TaxID=930804 RepID=A0A2S7KPR3_9FLAO|nr:phospho-sugar mutase [Aureitalea marina]PQB04600.1 phosphoglucomutase [Aureitalea marina]
MRYIEPELLEKVNKWLTPTFDELTQLRIKDMIALEPEELEDSFYKSLEFGTGGMRGIMGVGDNRINRYTLGKNTQGLSQYLKQVFPGESLKVAIAYDCRHNSKELARVVAEVFSANNIQVYLFSDLRPTPELSFAVRQLDCHCGIVLTASHNPPEYNGYKVYWQDGGQLVPPQDGEIIQVINTLDYEDVNFQAKEDLIQLIDKEIDDVFQKASVAHVRFTEQKNREQLKVVFTPLHGTSVTQVPQVLKLAGFEQVHLVEAQAEPNGDFPTVESPNPEEPEALKMALELGEEIGADIVIGTDPDCDRLGIAVRNSNGQLQLINGNQAMVVMAHYLMQQWKEAGRIDGKQFIGSTIVSTPMLKAICEDMNVNYLEGLTGFKWIAKMIEDHPNLEFIGGGEESFGFMVGEFVRDKDAVTASLLACELAAALKAQDKTIFDYLLDLYDQYGAYLEHLSSMVKKGKKGAEEIKTIMDDLRNSPLESLIGEKVVRVEDYQDGSYTDLLTGEQGSLDLPNSNVLIYYTEQGTKVAARPSGTEPKIKFYISVRSSSGSSDLERLSEKIGQLKTQLDI